MLHGFSALALASALLTVSVDAASQRRQLNTAYLKTCNQVASAVGQGEVTYFLNPTYTEEIQHYMSSSQQNPACVVTPKTTQDVSKIMKIISATRTPFAVQCGGHASNQGFSSTKGVHISLANFNDNTFNADMSAITVGAGQLWDNIYKATEGSGRQVIGGRVAGVGSGGFTIGGGGLSWLTNERGMTIDSAISFETVLANGTIITASESNAPDLFFALKGGGNDFGVVTRMTLQTYPQGAQVWGGLNVYAGTDLDGIGAATAVFQKQNKDVKANIITTMNTIGGIPSPFILFFYNGPTPPASTFSMFDSFKPIIKGTKTRTFSDLVAGTPSNVASGFRGAFHTVSLLDITPGVAAAVANETRYYGQQQFFNTGLLVSYDIEPFVSTIFDHSKGGAFPHTSAAPYLSLNLYFSWIDPGKDAFWRAAIKRSADVIEAAAIAEGQNIANGILYPNYCLDTTPLDRMYTGNVDRLKAIKKAVDPTNVMGLAGGFKFA